MPTCGILVWGKKKKNPIDWGHSKTLLILSVETFLTVRHSHHASSLLIKTSQITLQWMLSHVSDFSGQIKAVPTSPDNIPGNPLDKFISFCLHGWAIHLMIGYPKMNLLTLSIILYYYSNDLINLWFIHYNGIPMPVVWVEFVTLVLVKLAEPLRRGQWGTLGMEKNIENKVCKKEWEKGRELLGAVKIMFYGVSTQLIFLGWFKWDSIVNFKTTLVSVILGLF